MKKPSVVTKRIESFFPYPVHLVRYWSHRIFFPETHSSVKTSSMSDSKQPIVLITGLPRSGTTWLVHSLNLHPMILAFGETHFFTKRWIHPSQNGRYSPSELEAVWKKLASCPFWSTTPVRGQLLKSAGWLSKTTFEDLPEVISSARRLAGSNPTPADVLDSIGRAFCEREGKQFWVEKTASEGKNVFSTAKKIPDARFILTMREPVGFLLSYKSQGTQLSQKARDRHATRYHPLLAAFIWRLTYRSIRKVQMQYPDRVSVHILSDDQARRDALHEVCRQLGVEPDDSIYGLIKKRVNSSVINTDERTLARSELACIRFLCRADDPRLKPSENLSDIGLLDLFKSILTIPGWLIRNILKPRRFFFFDRK